LEIKDQVGIKKMYKEVKGEEKLPFAASINFFLSRVFKGSSLRAAAALLRSSTEFSTSWHARGISSFNSSS